MPSAIRHALVMELMLVQFGGAPSDFKTLPRVGAGVCEIRVRDTSGAFRAIYDARFADAIYVRHAFQKKTRETAKADLDLAVHRYQLIGG